jgi:hypothetical protein
VRFEKFQFKNYLRKKALSLSVAIISCALHETAIISQHHRAAVVGQSQEGDVIFPDCIPTGHVLFKPMVCRSIYILIGLVVMVVLTYM